MSRLAAVRTGQPTQGVGAAPSAVAGSPATPAASIAATSSSSVALPTPPLPTAIHPHGPVSAAATAAAAWLTLSATELDVRNHFRGLPVQTGLEQLAKMRRHCDLAAEVLQQRIDLNQTERCSGCGKTLEETRKSQWIMQGSEVDPDTGVPMPYRYCGPQCVRARNREKMLPPELRDQRRVDGEDIAEVR